MSETIKVTDVVPNRIGYLKTEPLVLEALAVTLRMAMIGAQASGMVARSELDGAIKMLERLDEEVGKRK